MFCKSYALSLRKIVCLCYISSRDTTPTKFDSMCLPCFSYQLLLFLACLKMYISCTHQTSVTRIGPCLFICLVQSDSYWKPLINWGISRIFYVVSTVCNFWRLLIVGSGSFIFTIISTWHVLLQMKLDLDHLANQFLTWLTKFFDLCHFITWWYFLHKNSTVFIQYRLLMGFPQLLDRWLLSFPHSINNATLAHLWSCAYC